MFDARFPRPSRPSRPARRAPVALAAIIAAPLLVAPATPVLAGQPSDDLAPFAGFWLRDPDRSDDPADRNPRARPEGRGRGRARRRIPGRLAGSELEIEVRNGVLRLTSGGNARTFHLDGEEREIRLPSGAIAMTTARLDGNRVVIEERHQPRQRRNVVAVGLNLAHALEVIEDELHVAIEVRRPGGGDPVTLHAIYARPN